MHRLREWDAVVTLEEEAQGDELRYVVLERTVVVETAGDLPEAFATAFDGRLAPPYRVVAVRRDGGVWALGARRIDVAELPDAPGEELELAVGDEGSTLLVDGERSFGSVPGLEALARERGLDRYVVHAERLDGDLWEVRVAAL